MSEKKKVVEENKITLDLFLSTTNYGPRVEFAAKKCLFMTDKDLKTHLEWEELFKEKHLI